MERFCTLKEFGEVVHLSPETLRDRIREGRLDAVRRYRGGNRDDPRSYRWLVSNEAGVKFMQSEILSAWNATVPRFPGFMRRERDSRGRLLSKGGLRGH